MRACVEWGVLTSSWSSAAELATRGGRGGGPCKGTLLLGATAKHKGPNATNTATATACTHHPWPRRAQELFRVRRKEFWPLPRADKLLNKFIPNLCHEADGLIFQREWQGQGDRGVGEGGCLVTLCVG